MAGAKLVFLLPGGTNSGLGRTRLIGGFLLIHLYPLAIHQIRDVTVHSVSLPRDKLPVLYI